MVVPHVSTTAEAELATDSDLILILNAIDPNGGVVEQRGPLCS